VVSSIDQTSRVGAGRVWLDIGVLHDVVDDLA
jgi:hypothetical protein